jgi:hypothetical protein
LEKEENGNDNLYRFSYADKNDAEIEYPEMQENIKDIFERGKKYRELLVMHEGMKNPAAAR